MQPPLLLKLEKRCLRKYRGKMEYEYYVIYKDKVLVTRKSTCVYIGGYIEKEDDKYSISFMFSNFEYLIKGTSKCPVMYAVAVLSGYENKIIGRMAINIIQIDNIP